MRQSRSPPPNAAEYEQQVLEWLAEASGDLPNAHLGHLVTLPGAAGEYEFDVVVRFSGFRGAEFVVLVECKRYRNAGSCAQLAF